MTHVEACRAAFRNLLTEPPAIARWDTFTIRRSMNAQMGMSMQGALGGLGVAGSPLSNLFSVLGLGQVGQPQPHCPYCDR